ncbi:acyl-CoA thioesterase [Mucilaginibacter sp. dw_454]|uniref:acyl-CoA thioesterase n=1 Tax=Mucilaginibacter sp. dw_454 TaxID=2720079 RepID=UPI001BD6DE70|nr:acyl-CoA thioesterase [Mucilaginibacter sp. dw_454]
MTDISAFKPVRFSETTITELMIPSYSNFGGKIHGGILLSLMDKVAYVCAAKHAGNYCVTASIDTVDFMQPVEVGELVSLMASINYVGNTSLVVGIRVVSENIKTNVINHTNTSYFTMVAKDEQNKPVQIPGLILENRDQVRRFIEAKRRKEIKQNYKNEVAGIAVPDGIEACVALLAGERAVLAK